MLDLIEKYGIPDDRVQSSLATLPAQPFFLKADFIEKYWQMAELPPEKLAETIRFARYIQNETRFRQLAWHLYRYITINSMSAVKADRFPDIIDGMDKGTGIFYLLIALSLIPSFIARAEREGFPRKYAEAGAKRIGSTTCFFAQNFDGAFGLRGRTLLFLLHYINTATWRIGRFDFVIQQADDTIPEIYRKEDSVIAFCADGVPLDKNSDRAFDAETAVRFARFKTDGRYVSGIPVDLHSGLAGQDEVTIDLADGYEKVAGPGDWTLFFHIPGGGGMKPELCRQSFAEAKEFFKEYAPDKNFRLIWSASWIFNPAWRELLPGSNMARLIDRGRLFPAFSTNNPGMYFVFGRNDGNADDFKPKNSVERAVLQCYCENRLRRTGWFILADEL